MEMYGSVTHSFINSFIHSKLAVWGTLCLGLLLTPRSTWTTPSCHLWMDVLSRLRFISLLLKAYHPCTPWTQFNLGLKIRSFFPLFMEGILHRRGGGVAGWAEEERLPEMAFLPSANSESPTWTPESH